jgi:hypothetical protein
MSGNFRNDLVEITEAKLRLTNVSIPPRRKLASGVSAPAT